MAVIAKYKFNSTLYADLIPEFNAEFTNYTVTDEITETDSEGNVIKTRVIEHDTLLPTLMRFGRIYVDGESTTDNRTDSLLKVLDMSTSGLTSCHSMFRYNTNLTSVSCEWDTSKITTMKDMFINCSNLTSLDVSNFDTSNVTDMYSMFYGCSNLTSLNVSNFNTSNTTNMNRMFCNCYNLTSLNVSNFNTSKVIDMSYMFHNCTNLTSLDISNFDTSKVTSMGAMFYGCSNLTSLDVSNFDTSKVKNMTNMFNGCTNLTSLDVSNFDTSKVTNFTNIFTNTSLLTDIGMLYCSQSTINALSSNIATPSTNVWVEGSIIDDLTSYDNVTYKAYYWEKEILLNSPLLEGDKIVKKEGKIYHYHKMGMVVLDGSEDWYRSSDVDTEDTKRYSFSVNSIKRSGFIICDNIGTCPNYTEIFPHNVANRIDIQHYYLIDLRWSDISSLKQWLQQNPTTVVYELANPYYELISDASDDLSLPLLSEDNIISNNSLIPTNMNVKNNGMSTVAMNTSTKYTVAFDKDTDGSVTIDLCGSTIDTTDNVVEITTPSELANDEITFIGDCEVSNVRILEGSVSGDAIPRETFEGLKNSFEDGRLPSKEDNVLHGFDLRYFDSKIIYGLFKPSIKLNKLYTAKVIDNTNKVIQTQISTGDGSVLWRNRTSDKIFKFTTNTSLDNVRFYVYSEKELDTSSINGFTEEDKANINIIVLEGDWTHLTEEDWNNLGKYKVEYKVTGKNKFDGIWEAGSISDSGKPFISEKRIRSVSYIKVKPNTSYIRRYHEIYVITYDKDKNFLERIYYGGTDKTFITAFNVEYIKLVIINRDNLNLEYQLEEGTVATEYEPYKEYTKTFYLNSPLLEGDTIEDINGVATHVKRSGKVVLDGSEIWFYETWGTAENTIIRYRTEMPFLRKYDYANPFVKSTRNWVYLEQDSPNKEYFKWSNNRHLYYYKPNMSNTDDFKQWLSENPMIAIYELASPVYEPISTESILCDSYVNGHLDVDSNIPIEKVDFRWSGMNIKYLSPSTDYIIQFNSDNTGLFRVFLGGYQLASNIQVVKGTNRLSARTNNTLNNTYMYFEGIGFNASNIQVVATERDNIGYFKGIQSSFEDKVIRNKNLFNKNDVIFNSIISQIGNIENSNTYCRTKHIECKPNTPYTCNVGTGIHYFDENKTWLSYQNHCDLSPSNAKYLMKSIKLEVDLNIVQIEEGIENTTYEEYNIYDGKYEVKVTLEDENGVISNETIYLNSPLLKGDKIEMYNGKLCHYHKMGKVVLDGSEDEEWEWYTANTGEGNTLNQYGVQLTNHFHDTTYSAPTLYCDKFKSSVITNRYNYNIIFTHTRGCAVTLPLDSKIQGVSDFRQWLQANPITVVYELLEPYYEDITPIQNEFIITSIGESSFTIDSGAIPTDGEITYSVNVKLLNDLEESINNNTSSTDTDLSTILDDIINE